MNTSECSLPHVHKHMKRRPVYAHSKAWQRLDDSLVELTDSRLNVILDEQGSAYDWTAQVIKDATIDDLDSDAILRKRKLIEGRLPHIFIAKDIAQVTDQKIEYSKHKGLDDKKCEALLLDSLKDHGSLTKPEIVRLLWDVLPDQLDVKQKNNKLDYLLKRLRKAGKIWTERNEVTSVWHLTEKQSNSVRLQALFREV